MNTEELPYLSITDNIIHKYQRKPELIKLIQSNFNNISIESSQKLIKKLLWNEVPINPWNISVGDDFIESNKDKFTNEKTMIVEIIKELKKKLYALIIELEQNKSDDERFKENIHILFSSSDAIDKAQAKEDIANFLIRKYEIKTVFGSKYDEIYLYNGKIHEENGHAVIKEEIESMLQELCTSYHVNEIVNKIKRKTRTNRDKIENTSENMICVNNGIIIIKDDLSIEKIAHSSKYRFLSNIETNYIPDAKCPVLKTMLKKLDEKSQITLQEIFGATIVPSNKWKKAGMFVGDGNTGKTTYIKTLIDMLGKLNVSSLSLQKICYDKFATANLYGKMANIYDDLSFTAIKDVGVFKIATGDGFLNGEKKHKDPFVFYSYSTLIFACNKIPEVKNADDAYYDRWVFVFFDEKIEKEQQDKELFDKLKNEMSGILCWALSGAIRLIKNKGYTHDMDIDEKRELMARSCSSIAQFVQDKLVQDSSSYMTRDELFNHYIDYCIEKSINDRKTKSQIGRELMNYCNFVVNGRKGNNKVWKNIKLGENKETQPEWLKND